MTVTDELRRLLDERGVIWRPSGEPWNEDVITYWYASLFKWIAIEGENGLWVNAGVAGYNSLTPEQAVEATVGRSEESYDAGFKAGVRATLQQLYELLHDYPTLDDIEAWADRQWEEEL